MVNVVNIEFIQPLNNTFESSKVMTPVTSYLVAENETQKAILPASIVLTNRL